MQIGCNDLQGTDLSRRLMHGSAPRSKFDLSGFSGNNVLRDHSWPTFELPRMRLQAWASPQNGSPGLKPA